MKVEDQFLKYLLFSLNIYLDELAKTRPYGRTHNAPTIPLTDDSDIQIIPGRVLDFMRQNVI